jgi:leader peptidase (prepilin peptidase)/N-methyltransferase
MCCAFFALFGYRQNGVALLFALAMGFIYSTLALVDLRCFLLPNGLVASGFALALLRAVLLNELGAFECASGAILCFAILAPLAFAKKMGMGDAKLFALSGAFLGLEGGIASLALGLALGGIACATLLAFKKAGRNARIPLAPFLAAGAALQAAFGPQMLSFWLSWLRSRA